MNELKEIIEEYRTSLHLVRGIQANINPDSPDKKVLQGMISDLQYALDWLRKGFQPDQRRGIERRATYQREILTDPVVLQTYRRHQNSESHPLSDMDQARIDEALSVLTQREKEMYLMAKGGGLSYTQIAEFLGVTKSTVQTTLQRAQKKINQKIKIS